MSNFMFNSYKSERDRRLLESLRKAILILKLEAQQRLHQSGFSQSDAKQRRSEMIEFLSQLENAVDFLHNETSGNDFNLAFLGIANRFIKFNPTDVDDRTEEIRRLRTKMEKLEEMREQDFHLLDRLQSHLEEEVAPSIQGLFRF